MWVAVDDGVAIRFNPDGEIDGLIAAGPVTTTRLRAISTQGWAHIDPKTTALPHWRQSQPPTIVEIVHAAEREKQKALESSEPNFAQARAMHPSRRVTQTIRNAMIRDFDSTDDYYKALAEVIKEIAPMTRSINNALADALEITPNTAGQYVSRCRKRGYLPPSRRSKP